MKLSNEAIRVLLDIDRSTIGKAVGNARAIKALAKKGLVYKDDDSNYAARLSPAGGKWLWDNGYRERERRLHDRYMNEFMAIG